MPSTTTNIDVLTQWAFAGLAIGLTMSIHLLTTTWRCYDGKISDTSSMLRWTKRFEDYHWWMQAALPIYMIHEFEEHGIDLFGNRYAFQRALCEGLGTPDIRDCSATPLAIFFVNVGTVWIGGTLARRDALGVGLNFFGTIAVNAVVHLIPFVGKGFKYNPGVLTSIILFLPASYMAAKAILAAGRCEDSDLARALMIGVVIHGVIIASFLGAGKGDLSESFVCFVQLLNVLPLLIK